MNKEPIDRLVEDLALSVADIGARGGLDEDMLAISWATHVIGFEPDVEEARRLAASTDPRWKKTTILPYAIAGSTGPAILHVPESVQGASLLRHNTDLVDRFGYDNLHITRFEVPVAAHTLDELRRTGVLSRIDYLKIDIEGAELDVLKAGNSVLNDCVAIKVECSFLQQRVGQALIWDVIPYLLSKQFIAIDFRDAHRWRRRNLPAHPYHINFTMPYSRGHLAQCDVVLLKTCDSLLDNDQALRLIIVSSVLGYYDYAIDILRTKTQLNAYAKEKYSCDLEAQLAHWSCQAGRRETRKAIAGSLRKLVPLLRSAVGRLPYPQPRRPF